MLILSVLCASWLALNILVTSKSTDKTQKNLVFIRTFGKKCLVLSAFWRFDGENKAGENIARGFRGVP